MATDTAAAASPVTDTSTWLSSDIVHTILSPSLMVYEDSIVVYNAKEVKTNRLLAVKRYRSLPGAKGALFKRMMENERAMLAAVRGGPHVIVTGAIFRNKGTRGMELYMEHYEYRLAYWMEETAESRALRDITIQFPPFYHTLLTQMLQALKFIHSKGIIHCAVLPPNIIYNNHNHFVLSEFVFSRHAHKRPHAHSRLTTAYMAPEVFDKKEITLTTDLWALGVILLDVILSLTVGGDLSHFTSDGLCKDLSELAAELSKQCEMPEFEMMLQMNPSQRMSASDLLEYMKRHPRPKKSTQEASAGILYRKAKLSYPDEDDKFLRCATFEKHALFRSRPENPQTTSLMQGNVDAVPVQQDLAGSSGQNLVTPSISRELKSEVKSEALCQENPKKVSLQDLNAGLVRQSLKPAAAGTPEPATTSVKIPSTTKSLEMEGGKPAITTPSMTQSQRIASSSASNAAISSGTSQEPSASASATSKKRSKSGASKRRGRMLRDGKVIDSEDVSPTPISSDNAAEAPGAGDGSNPRDSSCLVSSGSERNLTSHARQRHRQEPVCETAGSVWEKTQQVPVRQAEGLASLHQEGLQVEQVNGLLSAQNTGGHVRLTGTQESLRTGGPKLDPEWPAIKKEIEYQEAARARETIKAHKAVSAGQTTAKAREEAEEAPSAKQEEAVKAREQMADRAREEKAAKAREEKAARAREEKAARAREDIITAREAIRAREETTKAMKAARGVEAARHRADVDKAKEAQQGFAKASDWLYSQRLNERLPFTSSRTGRDSHRC